jgi:tetratricopeptide (TPR) repeat protein
VGRAKLEQRKLAQALDLAEELIKAHPDFSRGYFLKAIYHFEKGNFKETISCCDVALQKDPEFTQGYFLRAFAHFLSKSFDKCLVDVSAARSKAPMGGKYDILLLELQAGTYLSLGRFREAEGMYTVAVVLTRQKRPESCVLLWRCYGRQGKFGSSLALAKNFDNALPSWVRARSFAQAGLLDLAEKELAKTIKSSPGSPEALTTEALIRSLQGKHKDAMVIYVNALKLKPAPMVVDTGLRGAFILATCPDAKIRDPKNAKDIAKMCLEKLGIPEDKQDALVVLAVAKAAAGEFGEAIKDLEQSVKLDTSNKRITRACQELKRLFQRRRQYYYDPLMDQQPIFALDPARIITDPN